jgi:hypothetical protein
LKKLCSWREIKAYDGYEINLNSFQADEIKEWAKRGREWLEAIKNANTEKLQHAWCQVIEDASYYDVDDRDALFNLLLNILESGDTFTKRVRFAALQRLDEIVPDVEPMGFNEEALNLPLSRRA